MSNTHTTINCPNCATEIDVNNILYHQLEDKLKQKFAQELVGVPIFLKTKMIEKKVK